MKKIILVLILSFAGLTLLPAQNLLSKVEKAHKVRKYRKKSAIAFDLKLIFRGKERLDARITTTPGGGKIEIMFKDGRRLLWDGEKVWLSPSDSDYSSGRFDIFTWSYFFEYPFKLSDPGANWENKGIREEGGTNWETGKMTFDPGTGDSHKDWYYTYVDPETGLIHAAAYIVTFSRSVDKAEENPHAIVYTDYQKVKGIPFAMKWEFRNWSEEEGLADLIGEAKVSNISFPKLEEGYFTFRKDAKEVKYEPKK